MIVKNAKLFQAGSYPDKNIEITEADLDAFVANHPESGVDIKIEHTDTPFNGFMGKVKNLIRRGSELFGTVDIPDDIYAIADRIGARKLSVGIQRDKSQISEVSLVRHPRIADAAFSDNTVIFESESLGTLIDKIRSALHALYPETDTSYTMISYDNIHTDYAIVERTETDITTYYKIPWKETLDGGIELGEPVQVVHSWEPASFNETEIGGNAVADNTVDFAALQANNDELKAQINAAYAKIQELVFAKRQAEADATVNGWVQSGKLIPAQVEFAKAIILGGEAEITFGEGKSSIADMFAKFVEAMPAQIEMSETAGQKPEDNADFSADEKRMAELLGVKVEDIRKYRGDK
jgi:hypothetical protein